MSIVAYRIRTTGQYPVTEAALRAMYPNSALPSPLTQTEFDLFGFDPVFAVPAPAVDMQHTTLESAPTIIPGGYQQAWLVQPITDPSALAGILANQQMLMCKQIAATLAQKLSTFVYNFGGTIGLQTLQVRDFTDPTQRDSINWLTLKNTCDIMVAAGQGANLVEFVPVSNVVYQPTAAIMQSALLAMAVRGSQMTIFARNMKNAIAGQASLANLQAANYDVSNLQNTWPT